jgi:multisubunit Na+/H+ antiporter MnhE subunit
MLYVVMSMSMNYSWMATNASIGVITGAVTWLLTEKYLKNPTSPIFWLTLINFLLFYLVYQQESISKQEFLKIQTIERMNEDL